MFNHLGFAQASSLLGGIVRAYPSYRHPTQRLRYIQGVLLIAVPWVLVVYGPQIRARSKLASVGTPEALYLQEIKGG